MNPLLVPLIALLLLSLSDGANFLPLSPAISPTPEPSNSDCSTIIFSMMDCLSFLTIGSTDTNPTKSCCVGTETVLKFNPQCFCVGLESSRAMGFFLDNTRILAMPSICDVPIDPNCDAPSPVASTPPASTISPSVEPPKTSRSPPSSLVVTSSPPAVTHSPAAVTHSSPTAIALSPAATAPSPSKSDSENLSVSKIFLGAVIVSSFAYIWA